jgi:acyl-[acyl-carrier-protein] desaturase
MLQTECFRNSIYTGTETMALPLQSDDPMLRKLLYTLYREFFDHAEKKRRWSLETDIPWDKINRNMDPAIADIVACFCSVEMFLPDYIAKALPMIRTNRGWSWFHANWGYEESKHSLALSDWLLRSGLRSDEQMTDMENEVFAHEWNLPYDSPHGMLIYAMIQEMATWLSYRNLRARVDEHGDPALSRILQLVAIDERAHHAFYRRAVEVFLSMDRAGTIEQLRRVLLTFKMPAVHLLADGRQRVADIKAMGVFDDDMYLHEVYQPILEILGVSPRELRRPSHALR